MTEQAHADHVARWSLPIEAWHDRFGADPRLRLELAYCTRLGIPHSQFLSWPESDQDKALAYEVWDAQRCRDCGVHPLEWPDPRDRPFAVEMVGCWGCREVQAEVAQAPKDVLAHAKPRLVPTGVPPRSHQETSSDPPGAWDVTDG